MIAKDKIQEILDKSDIVEVISDYVMLEKVGSNYRGLCPFHDDKSPSFYVSPSKKIGSCMSCKVGGNVITLLQKLNNYSFDEACKKLADRYGIELKIRTIDKFLNDNRKYYEITNYATKYYQFYLNNSEKGKNALEYLHKRGLNDETINMFKIGLAPSEKSTLYYTLKDQNFLELDMIDVGLINKGDNYYDMFNNRVIFPIIDDENNVIGFSGRIYYESEMPKYVNSTNNAIFDKSKVLYNINNALDGIRKKKRIIIMEGFMDVIASYNAGLKESVCTMGTALTNEHVKLIKKYTKNVVLCFDGDEAGMHATERAIDILKAERLNIAIASLPENLDPDEYIKKYGKQKFLDVFENELLDSYTFRYRFARFGHDLDNTIESETFKLTIFKMLLAERTQTIIEKYLRMLSMDLKISFEAIAADYKNYFNKELALKHVEKRKEVKEIQQVKNGTLTAYQTLIKYMLINRSQQTTILGKIDALSEAQRKYIPNLEQPYNLLYLIYDFYKISFDDPYFLSYDEFISRVYNYYQTYNEMNIEEFQSKFLDVELSNFYDAILEPIKIAKLEKNAKQEIEDCLLTLNGFVIQCAIKKYDELLKGCEDNDYKNMLYGEKIRLKKELDMLKNKKQR